MNLLLSGVRVKPFQTATIKTDWITKTRHMRRESLLKNGACCRTYWWTAWHDSSMAGTSGMSCKSVFVSQCNAVGQVLLLECELAHSNHSLHPLLLARGKLINLTLLTTQCSVCGIIFNNKLSIQSSAWLKAHYLCHVLTNQPDWLRPDQTICSHLIIASAIVFTFIVDYATSWKHSKTTLLQTLSSNEFS